MATKTNRTVDDVAHTIQVDKALGYPSIGDRVKTPDGLTGKILRRSAAGTGRRVVVCEGDAKERIYYRNELTLIEEPAAPKPTLAEIVAFYGRTALDNCQKDIERFTKTAAINPVRAVEDSRSAIIGSELKWRIERLMAAAEKLIEAELMRALVEASKEAADELLRWSASRSTCQFTNAVDLCKFEAVREWGKLTQKMAREFDKSVPRNFSTF